MFIFHIRYKEVMRVIVGSASLTEIDWERTAQFGWYIDLPLIRDDDGNTKCNLMCVMLIFIVFGIHCLWL